MKYDDTQAIKEIGNQVSGMAKTLSELQGVLQEITANLIIQQAEINAIKEILNALPK
uniref:Uncharacterized protein n=1 Tax=viral metagenome TaxID=1070528 RepID=A0A6M3IEX4_9ZZZZ